VDEEDATADDAIVPEVPHAERAITRMSEMIIASVFFMLFSSQFHSNLYCKYEY